MSQSGAKFKVISLHGFLGLPSDWDLIRSYFMVSPLAHQFEWWAADYMKTRGLTPENDFSTWAVNFNRQVQQQFSEGPRVLIGYSLGGRLALQALKAAPDLYEKVILVSTNPGLKRDKEKEDRAQQDLRWSEKFLNMPWAELMNEWNAQAVFKDGSSEPRRMESNYDRSRLAQSLLEWSLAQQEDFRNLILEQSSKILWVSGEKDIKFASIAMELKKRSPAMQSILLPRSSHRVIFDQAPELAQKMIGFIQEDFGD